EESLARRSPPRVADPGYTITAQGEPSPAPQLLPGEPAPSLLSGQPALAHAPPTDGLRRRVAELQVKGQERFLAYLRCKSDERLERIVGAGPCMKAIFRAMAKRFQPDKAQGFSGSIQYDPHGPARTHR